jgi:predicted glutamine amidotransferase
MARSMPHSAREVGASASSASRIERRAVCRFFGLRASDPTSVACCLVRAPNSLMAQSRQDLQGFENADGWGIAAYDEDGLKSLRDASPAHLGDDFRSAAARLRARTILAHVRRATVGAMVAENTHPFTHGDVAFVHNGTVPYFEDIRPSMLAAMTGGHRAAIRGATDSEHLFHLILSACEHEPERPLLDVVRETLLCVLRWCRAIGPYPRLGLNVLLTDGERMVGSRWQRTLSWLERRTLSDCEVCGLHHADCDPLSYRALVIASEPITNEAWQEVPERSVYELTPDFRLRIEALEEV